MHATSSPFIPFIDNCPEDESVGPDVLRAVAHLQDHLLAAFGDAPPDKVQCPHQTAPDAS